MMLASAVFYALYQIVVRRVAAVNSPATTAFYCALGSTLAMSFVVPFHWKTPDNWGDVAMMMSLGISGGLGHYCVARAFSCAPANLIAPLNYTQMIGSVVVGYLMFADSRLLYLARQRSDHRRRPARGLAEPAKSLKEDIMPYLVADDLPKESAGQRFRALLDKGGILQMPGAHNGLAALQAKRQGSRRCISRAPACRPRWACPISASSRSTRSASSSARSRAPRRCRCWSMATPAMARRSTSCTWSAAFEEAGAGAVHIEDQLLPKKCGHLNDKKLADPDDMAAKVAAAAQGAARSRHHRPHRCSGERGHRRRGRAGQALHRGRCRCDLSRGADQRRDVPRRSPGAMPGVKLLANMTEFGRTPFFTASEFEAMGYRMVIWPVSRAARRQQGARGALRGASARRRHPEHARRMQTRAELYETIGYHDYEALDATIVGPSCRKACRSARCLVPEFAGAD